MMVHSHAALNSLLRIYGKIDRNRPQILVTQGFCIKNAVTLMQFLLCKDCDGTVIAALLY